MFVRRDYGGSDMEKCEAIKARSEDGGDIATQPRGAQARRTGYQSRWGFRNPGKCDC